MALIILDRDGVINQDSDDYIKSPEEWQALPGSLEAIARLSQYGYHVVIASNQSGLARKLFTIETLNAIHQKMHNQLSQLGGRIEAIFFCPHAPKHGCNCRKPRPGLLQDISRRLRMTLKNVPCVGDKLSDIEAALAVDAKPILVRTGYGRQLVDAGNLPAGVAVFDDLAAVADSLTKPE
ncbi:MAG: D-glycero-beta-D-manno-heptose-1,7-bisphosphate 7-phosphatase [Gammaproteobacteria bacterium RBG_16_51_14]|nr:MAG: D-glycero-beta-D-manno-heptose-1,7-bisphosphate 7-phosphatase [Gammaproteobacteria bacterium RBG_16_51_14]